MTGSLGSGNILRIGAGTGQGEHLAGGPVAGSGGAEAPGGDVESLPAAR